MPARPINSRKFTAINALSGKSAMLYRVVHTTHFSYSHPVPLCQNELHLTPRDTARQSCREHRLDVQPAPQRIDNYRDYFGNHVNFFTISEGHRELSVTAEGRISVTPASYIPPEDTPPWEAVRDAARAADSAETLSAREFAFESPHVTGEPQLESYARPSFRLSARGSRRCST